MNDLSHLRLSRTDTATIERRFDAIASFRRTPPTAFRDERRRSNVVVTHGSRYLDDPVGDYETTVGGW
jgi:hypothetical protein